MICPTCRRRLKAEATSCLCGWGGRMPAVDLYAEHKAASLRNYGVSRRNDSPLVEEIRRAYLGSKAGREKMGGHISESLPRVPGEDDEERAA